MLNELRFAFRILVESPAFTLIAIITLALGAQAGDVLRLVVRQGMAVAMSGVGLGLAGALALSRGISGLHYGVKTVDPTTYIEILIPLVSVAFVVCYVPARRAAKLNPVTALAQT